VTPAVLLVDYGEVISTPQPAASISRMAELAELDEDKFANRYWASRPAYDAGCAAADYWARVLDQNTVAAELRDALVEADMHSWTQLDQRVLDLLTTERQRGTRLALLSNAPHELADAVSALPAFTVFDELFFSSRLGQVKPDPEIFRLVLDRLDEPAAGVVFVDDRAENIVAAQRIGLGTLHFTSYDRLRDDLTQLRTRR
jgi:putative hydrolase of the HAD superfamily